MKRPGFKFAEHEMKGIPVRIVFGPRDLEENVAEVARRDNLTKESISQDNLVDHVENLLTEIQANIYTRAKEYRNTNTRECTDYEDFQAKIAEGGFVITHWDGTSETEEKSRKKQKLLSVVFLMTTSRPLVLASILVRKRSIGYCLRGRINC